MSALGRREFLGVCGGAVACLAAGACASVVAHRVSAVGGRVSLALADHPELQTVGGAITIQPDTMSDPVIVLNSGGGRYTALSPICTHRGCTVERFGAGFKCPCHGSGYDREGRVTNGPAELPLTSFPTTVAGDRLVINLGRFG